MRVDRPLPGAELVLSQTRARQTPVPAMRQFTEVLRRGSTILVSGAQAALRTLPGGELLSAALQEGVRVAGESASSQGGAFTNGALSSEQQATQQMLRESAENNMFFLRLQQELNEENRRFSTLSQVLKTRHETARAVIGNI